MYVECYKNNGIDYLRLVENKRVINSRGVKTSTKKYILAIGPLSRYDDGEPDYVERLKKSFKAGVPMIDKLAPYCKETESPPPTKHAITITDGSPDCFGEPKLFSHRLLERIIEELGLRNYFASYKGFTKIRYDVYGFFKLLAFGRVLNPASKHATVAQNDDYYEPVMDAGFNPDNVYDTLDFICDNKEGIMKRINTNLAKKAGRKPEIIYYDVTNFYYETGDPDDDVTDDDGNVIEKGIRKNGVCKEERKLPIVQMGLFMDDDGLPIAVKAFPGNTLDHQTLKPALEKTVDGLEFSRFILIGDRGICIGPNLLHLLDAGHGYIVSKSLLKTNRKEREWAYSDDDYIEANPDYKYKSRIIKHEVTDEDGKKRKIEEKVVVYWSRKFQMRAEKENKKFLDFLEKLEQSPNNFRITAKESKGLKQFFKKECVNTKTGEIVNSSDIKPLIDFDKVRVYKKSLGYYQIVTSELEMDALTVIDKYHGLTQIEEQFRIMKGTLETRPLYVYTREHIEAHLLICMIALIMVRIIQNRILKSGLVKKDPDMYWSTGLSAERLQKALNKWSVDKMPDDYYRFMNIKDPDLKIILDAFGINIPAKLYRRAELKSIKTAMEIFI